MKMDVALGTVGGVWCLCVQGVAQDGRAFIMVLGCWVLEGFNRGLHGSGAKALQYLQFSDLPAGQSNSPAFNDLHFSHMLGIP